MSKTKTISNKEYAKTIEKAGKQYRVYKELHDVVHLVQSTSSHQRQPVEQHPSFEYPHIRTIDMRKK